jgi:prolyl oligopeptidase
LKTSDNLNPHPGNIIAMSTFRLKGRFSFSFILAFLFAGTAAPSIAASTPTDNAQLRYPSARKGNVVDDYHGNRVADPYRWLEELDSPETRAWVSAQAKLSDSYLKRIPSRVALKQRLIEVMNFEKFGIPFHEADRYFYTHNSGLQEQSELLQTEGISAKAKVILDPNTISTNGSLAVVGYVASKDGTKMSYGVSQGGSDWTDWRIRDLNTLQDLPDTLRWTKYYRPVFTPDGHGLYYSAFSAPHPGEELSARDLDDAVYYHELGQTNAADRRVFSRPDHPDWQFEPHLTPDGHWLLLMAGEGEVGDKGKENIYGIELGSTNSRAIPLAEGFQAGYFYIGYDNGLIYFQTTLNAPRGRVIAIDPKNPTQSRWKVVVPEGPDAMDVADGSVTLVDHQLIFRTLHDAHTKVSVYRLDGGMRKDVALPGLGTAYGFAGEPEDKGTFFSYTDLVTPPTVFHLDLETLSSTVFRAPKIGFDLGTLESKQAFFPAKDGTPIPIYLVSKKGLKKDGTNPTLLYGYGGFGISVLPHFDPGRLVWLERGGIYAIANIRGGGEYGEPWHQQGMREHKQTVFDDFISAAQWLINQKHTSTPRLAISGASNGGLLVGACLTQRPDLFGAVLAHVGVMDMLRFNKFGQGAGWEGDFGSPENPVDFKMLYAYSPYHNVHSGTRYPATLIFTGDHDTRVMPAHSFKFTAALQAAQAGTAPILLRVELSGGHGSGPTTSQHIEETADAYAFLLQNLGMSQN